MFSGVNEEDEMESDDWNLVSKKGQEKRMSGRNETRLVYSQSSKRGLEENSSEEESRGVRKRLKESNIK